jgi:Sulfotransferase domain
MARITDQQVRALKYVRVPPGGVDLEHFPNFLIAGPQRTGTTWLHKNIESHPEVFMTSPKELFYFNLLESHQGPLYRSSGLDWYLKFFEISEERRREREEQCRREYQVPFTPKIRGEATAGYAAMGPHLIREITVLNPDIKVLIIIRHPVDRAWSHAKLDLTEDWGHSIDQVSDKDLERFFATPYQRRCAQYQRQIANWQPLLKPDALMLGWFEDIQENPGRFLERVFRFLGVRDNLWLGPGRVTHHFNETDHMPMPPRVRALLTRILRKEIAGWEELTLERRPV